MERIIDSIRRAVILDAMHPVGVSGNVCPFIADNTLKIPGIVASMAPVQSGSGDPTYDNPRPITGRTGAVVYRCGKNLFNTATVTDKAYIPADGGTPPGTPSSSTSAMLTALIPVIAGETYAYSGYRSTTGTATHRINYYIGNEWQSQDTLSTSRGTFEKTITIPAGITGIRISLARTHTNLQLELGSGFTAYEAYAGESHSFDWTSAAGTVYEGVLDAAAGTITPSKDYFTGLGSNIRTNGGYPVLRTTFNNDNYSAYVPIMSNMFSYLSTGGFSAPWQVRQASVGVLYWSFPTDYTDEDILAVSPNVEYLLYRRESARSPIQLTPAIFHAALGRNYVWSDCGDTSITYWKHN